MNQKTLRGLACLVAGLGGGVVVAATLGPFGFLISAAVGISGFREVQKREYGKTAEKMDYGGKREMNSSAFLPNARGSVENEAYFNRNRRR